MGNYEVKIYLNNQLLKNLEIKNSTSLSEIRKSCESEFDSKSYYYFISKDGETIKKDSNFTAKDVVQKDSNGYKIKIRSEQFSFKVNIYIDNQLIKNIDVTKETKLSEIRNLCQSNFKNEIEEYYFISPNGDILKNDSDFTVEKVWEVEKNNEYKIQLKVEKIKYKVNVYIDNIFKTFINITKETKLTDIRELCQSYFQEDKNYYFSLENNAIIKNDSNLIAENIMKKENNDYKIFIQSEEIYKIVSVYLNEIKKTGILCNYSQSLDKIKDKIGQDLQENDIYFLTANRAIIENYNINDFKLNDIIVDKYGEPKIYTIDKSYRPKFTVIEHLNMLREQASSGTINWYEQTEFFKKVEDFAGQEISNALKDELLGTFDPNNEKKTNDKEFINKYIILLLKKDDANKIGANQKNLF